VIPQEAVIVTPLPDAVADCDIVIVGPSIPVIKQVLAVVGPGIPVPVILIPTFRERPELAFRRTALPVNVSAVNALVSGLS